MSIPEPAPRQAPQSVRTEIEQLAGRLHPVTNRHEVYGRIDDLFRSGSVPDPSPAGFLGGSLLMTSTFPIFDSFARWLSSVWMPWLGKAFDPSSATGVNRLTPGARLPLRVIWPSYEPPYVGTDHIDAFPFRTRVEAGAVDPRTRVLVIEYDFEANPSFLIRPIRDELVQVDDGYYLGKILFRWQGRHRPIGFFSLGTTD
jgi:hypothetical protein